MGDGFALQWAPRGGYVASAANYGEIPNDPVMRLAGSRTVMASYGALDRIMGGSAERLESVLAELGVPHDVRYSDAGHSFMNRINAGPLLTRSRA